MFSLYMVSNCIVFRLVVLRWCKTNKQHKQAMQFYPDKISAEAISTNENKSNRIASNNTGRKRQKRLIRINSDSTNQNNVILKKLW